MHNRILNSHAPTKMDTLFKKWSFRQNSNQFFAFVYVFPIRQDNVVDNYLNINLKTGIAVKICFLSTIPQLLWFFFKLLWYPLLTFYLVCISLSWYDIPEIVFVIMIISLTAGLLLARNSHNQGLSVVTLTSSLGMFYGRCNNYVNRYKNVCVTCAVVKTQSFSPRAWLISECDS